MSTAMCSQHFTFVPDLKKASSKVVKKVMPGKWKTCRGCHQRRRWNLFPLPRSLHRRTLKQTSVWKQASKCASLGGLAVLLVRHLDPLTARPAPHLTLVLVAVSVAAANHLLRGKTVEQCESYGTNLSLRGAACGAGGFQGEVGALARVSQLHPSPAGRLHGKCTNGHTFPRIGHQDKGCAGKREEIAPPAARKGFCRWRRHSRKPAEPQKKRWPFFCSILNHLSWAAHPAARLYLIQAFLQRHLNVKWSPHPLHLFISVRPPLWSFRTGLRGNRTSFSQVRNCMMLHRFLFS